MISDFVNTFPSWNHLQGTAFGPGGESGHWATNILEEIKLFYYTYS